MSTFHQQVTKPEQKRAFGKGKIINDTAYSKVNGQTDLVKRRGLSAKNGR